MRFLAIALLFASTPALAAEQFDLDCQGTKVTKSGGAAEPYSFRVQVDLTAQKWCMDKCQRVASINAVQPDRIVLADDSTYNSRMDVTDSVTVDPKTFAFKRLMVQERPEAAYLKVEAACKQAPFTAFPAAGASAGNDVGADGLPIARNRAESDN